MKQKGLAFTQILLWLLVLLNTSALVYYFYTNTLKQSEVPYLVGTWHGQNLTLSNEKGYQSRPKQITITEQKDYRFRGSFNYAGKTKHFFGVIYPDNKSFTWVSTTSHGFVHGRIIAKEKIAACYLETWESATTGCATLERK